MAGNNKSTPISTINNMMASVSLQQIGAMGAQQIGGGSAGLQNCANQQFANMTLSTNAQSNSFMASQLR